MRAYLAYTMTSGSTRDEISVLSLPDGAGTNSSTPEGWKVWAGPEPKRLGLQRDGGTDCTATCHKLSRKIAGGCPVLPSHPGE